MRKMAGEWRLWTIGLTVSLLMTGLLTRLSALHLAPGAGDENRIRRGRSFERDLPGSRGRIFESGSLRNTLALNIDLKDVCADPKRLQDEQRVMETALILTEELGLELDALKARLSRPGRRFEYVQRFVPEAVAQRIARHELPGVFFRDTTARYYPQGNFLCHVIGFANHEGIGSAGIEQHYQHILAGTPGMRHELLDGIRREITYRRIHEVAPLSGGDVVLTIDQTVQHLVERELDEAMREHGARAAWAVVQRVRTGEVLAMASRPAYDLNDFRASGEDERLNRVIGAVFEPGSVMKPMVVAAAVNEGLVTPATVFDCENGLWYYRRRPLRDYRPHGRLSVADIIQKSSNIGTAKVALEMGDERLEKYLRAFGFGSSLGIDLPGEEKGILHAHQNWSSICATRIAIGQGVAVTALQVLSAVNAIANDGFLMRPYIVSEIRRPHDSKVLYRGEPVVLGRPIGARAAAQTLAMMQRVTETGGTGRAARMENVSVAGKTGTGQKAVAGGYSSTDYIAAFVGFFPSENPEVGIIVVIDEPRPLYTGGAVAAPVFRRVAEPLARYLDIETARHETAQNPEGMSPL